MTFRSREDGLCPRCTHRAEALIERIELDGLTRDLNLITEFDAYYQRREQQKRQYRELGTKQIFARVPRIDDRPLAIIVPFPNVAAPQIPDPHIEKLQKARER